MFLHPLTGGLTIRYAAACLAWFSFRLGRSFVSAQLLPLLISSAPNTKNSNGNGTSSHKVSTAAAESGASSPLAPSRRKSSNGGNASANSEEDEDNAEKEEDAANEKRLAELTQQQQVARREQLLREKKSRLIRRALIRNLGYLKIWLCSHAMDMAVSLFAAPGPWLVGRHTSRVMIDAFLPAISDLLFRFDRFNHAVFLTYASTNLLFAAPNSEQHTSSSLTTSTADQSAGALNAFLWGLPSACLSIAKLFFRVRKYGVAKTHVFTCLSVITLQYLVRVPMMSFATMLPMSDAELLMCTLCVVTEKMTEAHLYYHTWPWQD